MRDCERGGGTATLAENITTQVISAFKINKDTNALKLRFQNQYLWVINVYIHDGSITKIQKLFGKVRQQIPNNEWKATIIIGDFNIDAQDSNSDFKLMKSICKSMGMTIHVPNENTTATSKIDYIITGSLFEIQQVRLYGSYGKVSDHKAINWTFNFKPLGKNTPITIPDRKIADMLSLIAINDPKVKDSQDFLNHIIRERKRNKLMKTIKIKKNKEQKLLDTLLSLENSNQAQDIVNNYWSQQWRKTEETRFSEESKEAYNFLKRILKYNLIEKRDGAIIRHLLNDEGNLVTEQPEVDKELAKTMKEIQIDESWGWIEKKKFPKLPRIDATHMEDITNLLTSGKAVAFDAIADSLFKGIYNREGQLDKECPKAKTISKLRNIWRVDLDNFLTAEDTWGSRLVALNKVFPQTPTRTQLRPIMIQSALIKLIEARFLPKLRDYLERKLDRSQTGFIPRMGIHVNLDRALSRITERTKHNRACYGLFIDFQNAYNSVPLTLLFKKLRSKQIFDTDEVDYLEQLYARYRIRIGNSSLAFNRGLAQGSIISPALFNIFIEDLGKELQDKADLNIKDILMYADDIMTICASQTQLNKAIQTIEEWCRRNGMILNKKKSGIVVFAPRRATDVPMMKLKENTKIWIPAKTDVAGIPICEKYKYLGTWLNPKLTSKPQIEQIRKKAGSLFIKLYPYLAQASADGRRDMFMTMVAPLFNAAHILLHYEPSVTHKNNLETTWRGILKQFLMISKRTNTVLVEEMSAKTLTEMATRTQEQSSLKWQAREKYEDVPFTCRAPTLNKLRAVPNTWCKLVNTMVKPCPKCKKPGVVCNRWHLKHAHGKQLSHINKIWREEIVPITIRPEMKRQDIKEQLEPIILQHLREFDHVYTRLNL